ncbi:MAG TPA: GNAT family N-acetyltransferase [Terriglobales bacterium]|nr:GNAT family N-acetyltransferase [Terriglobales bacterium]
MTEPLGAQNCEIRAMVGKDWPQVLQIYREGISTGNATFETDPPSWEMWNSGHLPDCRLVALDHSQVLGWAALSPVSSRRVYAGVTEVSVYVGSAARSKGVGRALLLALICSAEAAGIWTLQAGIFPENVASIHLHNTLGFREVGRRERIGKMGGRWRDVMLLERRSQVAGIG